MSTISEYNQEAKDVIDDSYAEVIELQNIENITDKNNKTKNRIAKRKRCESTNEDRTSSEMVKKRRNSNKDIAGEANARVRACI